MSKGVCKYCGKATKNEYRAICDSCSEKKSDIRWFMEQLEPYRVALARKKVREMFNDKL